MLTRTSSLSHHTSFDWHAKITTIKGVGEKIAEKLAKMGIFSVGDLLLHCPYRYEDRSHLTPIRDLNPESWAVIQGEIIQCKIVKGPKKRAIITVADKTGAIKLLFFHFQISQAAHWQMKNTLRCFGQVKQYGGLQMTHPEYEIIDPHGSQILPAHLTPIYPATAGISQNFLRKIIRQLLSAHANHLETDVIHERLAALCQIPHFSQALETIHFPTPDEKMDNLAARDHLAYRRLIIEELFAHHISLQRIRDKAQECHAMALSIPKPLLEKFIQSLGFTLTDAQKKVWNEINSDLSKTRAMLRLIQGDVGCGKTVIAALSALAAVSSSKQVAIMVPTEILAEQHFMQFQSWFAPLGYRCELLVSKLKAKNKRDVLENMTLGLTNIVIGTHALFQDKIRFKELGLVIIDEQHRFGVHQRLSLQMKGLSACESTYPHQLVMTATPIPRTLMMSHYAHLDISIIDGMPPNRLPITTLTIHQARRSEIIERMNGVCQKGQQVYWVCTLIEESEALECQAATKVCGLLQSQLSAYKVGLVHGKMDPLEKESVMQAFYRNELAVLVATTVIEVGVNVPNATLMIIENPERLGLAQLHQLRGRVGRGSESSFCVLLYQAPLSQMAQSRLRTMRESQDGFIIAEKDLELRGPGEVLGVRQTGSVHFKIADLMRDREWIKKFSNEEIVLDDLPEDEIEKIIQRWCGTQDYTQA